MSNHNGHESRKNSRQAQTLAGGDGSTDVTGSRSDADSDSPQRQLKRQHYVRPPLTEQKFVPRRY